MQYVVKAHDQLEKQLIKAQGIADGIEKVDGNGTYRVPSLSGADPHTVTMKRIEGDVWASCDCKGFAALVRKYEDKQFEIPACVHMVAVLMRAGKLDWLTGGAA